MVVASAMSNASLQFRCTTPKALKTKPKSRHYEQEQEEEEEAIRSSRYRLLTSAERMRESQQVDQIIQELRAQRRKTSIQANIQRPSSATSKSRRSSADETRKETSETLRSTARASKDLSSSSFEATVLKDLQQLKQAQLQDLETVEALKRAKEEAEARARRLEDELRKAVGRKPNNQRKEFVIEELEGDQSGPPPIEDEDQEHDDDDSDLATPIKPLSMDFSPSKGSPSPVFFHKQKPTPAPESMKSPPPPSYDQLLVFSLSDTEDEELERQKEREAIAEWKQQQQTSSRGRTTTRSQRSRSNSIDPVARSKSREDALRRSAFFEEKRKAQEEAERLAAEAAAKLERAKHAKPPAKLLQRQEQSQRKKQEQLAQLEHEMYESTKEKHVKARPVPLSTYVQQQELEHEEQVRKDRIAKRSQELLQSAQLPMRMAKAHATAKEQEDLITKAKNGGLAINCLPTDKTLSVKMKNKLREAAAEEAAKKSRKPKPVPNFDQLHHQWKKALDTKKQRARKMLRSRSPQDDAEDEEEEESRRQQSEFFIKRAAQIEALKAKKEERKRRQEAKELELKEKEKQRQQQLLAKVQKHATPRAATTPKSTKAEELRVKKVQEALRRQEQEKQQEEEAKEARERRLKEAQRRIAAQVKALEDKRKSEYSGTFVELNATAEIASERAKAARQQFKEAMQRNKEKILMAVATRPSLMERFGTEVKREEHKKMALEAVVKNVFGKKLKNMKGILTDEEEQVAKEMLEADEEKEEQDDEEEPKPKQKNEQDDYESDFNLDL